MGVRNFITKTSAAAARRAALEKRRLPTHGAPPPFAPTTNFLRPMSSPGHRTFDTGHTDLVHDVAFDFYGKRVASCSSDHLIKVYEPPGEGEGEGAPPVTLKGHQGPVFQVAWAHPQFGTLLASCGYDKRVIVFREAGPGNWVQAGPPQVLL